MIAFGAADRYLGMLAATNPVAGSPNFGAPTAAMPGRTGDSPTRSDTSPREPRSPG